MLSHGSVEVSIHNGNRDITIDKAEITITDLSANKTFDYRLSFKYPYNEIYPLSAGEAFASVLYVPEKWGWDLKNLKTKICK
jgi:hypothetical protein